MKRQAVLVSLGLIAGVGLGYSVGVRRAPVIATAAPARTEPVPAPSPRPAAPAPRDTAAGEPARPAPETARRELAAWVAAGASDEKLGTIFQQLEAWAESDPQAALAFVLSAPRFPQRKSALALPLAVLCRRDPNHVIAWLHANLPEQERGGVAEIVIRRIHRANPREALVLAEADQTPVGRHSFAQIFQQLVQIAPAEAVAAFNRLSDGGREMTAHSIAYAWAESDPAAARRWVESLRGQPGARSAQHALLGGLVDKDIDQALTLMRQWNLAEEDTNSLLQMIAYRKPEAVPDLLGEVPAAQRGELLGVALRERFATAPDRLVTLARQNLPPAEAASLISYAWQRWLNEDRPAAEAWAAASPDASLRSDLELVKLRDTARTDPNLFLASITNYPGALESEKPLIHDALAQLNSDVAGAWIARHPGVVDPDFVAATAAGFFEWNRDEALVWAHLLPPGETQNRALASIAQRWTASGDPAQAAATLAAITDPHVQTGTRFQVFSTLYRKDRATAVQWLAAQPVTPEIRANWETLAATSSLAGNPEFGHLD